MKQQRIFGFGKKPRHALKMSVRITERKPIEIRSQEIEQKRIAFENEIKVLQADIQKKDLEIKQLLQIMHNYFHLSNDWRLPWKTPQVLKESSKRKNFNNRMQHCKRTMQRKPQS